MKIDVVHEVAASPDALLTWVSDLERYPQWTRLLHSVSVERDAPAGERAWLVELRGKIGPFARSKRLRMVRVPTEGSDHLRFERSERDGRSHGLWNLDVRVEPIAGRGSTKVSVVFEYEGRLWSGAVERLLREEIESSKRRLSELASSGSQSCDQAP